MAYEKKGQGSLNKNDKGDNDKRPDYWGKAEVDGVKYSLSAWINKNDDGSTWLWLSFTTPKEKEEDDTPF